jgi:hypothetical protein
MEIEYDRAAVRAALKRDRERHTVSCQNITLSCLLLSQKIKPTYENHNRKHPAREPTLPDVR